MKKIIVRIFVSLLVISLLTLITGFIFFKIKYPAVNVPENITVGYTQDRFDRGKYLFNNLCGCRDCHSKRDFTKLNGPIIPGTEGMGGEVFDKNMGLPGTFYAKNITPMGLVEWTDGEVIRAITEGVDKDGKVLFPVMPYLSYGKMDREDIYSIIVYLRSLKPVQNNPPESKADFPVNIIMRTFPQKSSFTNKPNVSNSVEYGKYLVNSAACSDCHTPVIDNKPDFSKSFAGGNEYILPGIKIFSANITPDEETGIGSWTKEQFISKFKAYQNPAMSDIPVKENDYNTIMPWIVFSGLTENDLSCMYDYLKTLKPVKNKIIKFTKLN